MFVSPTRYLGNDFSTGVATLRRMNRLFDNVFGPDAEDNGSVAATWMPACDVIEEKEALRIVTEVPGIRPEDVKLSVEGNALTIRGERRQTEVQKNDRIHRSERVYGVFERTFTLPSTVDSEHIQATYDAGLLTVTLPKVERARPREIPVKTLAK